MPPDSPVDQPKGLGAAARLDLAVLCAAVALAAALLAAFAWNRPTTATSTIGYQQSGFLSYTAPTSPTSIYGSAGVQTGQPVYTQLVQTLDVTYTYQLTSSAPSTLHGTEQLVAVLTKGAGFTRTVALQSPTPFKGDKFTAAATLHLTTLEAMVAAFNKFTADNANTYSVTISPHVTVQGRLGTEPLKTDFDQATRFQLNETTLTPSATTQTNAQGSGPTGETVAGRIGRPIVSTASGSVKIPSARQATLFAGLPVLDARWISLSVLALALFSEVLVAWPLIQKVRSDDERVRIATKLSSSLVEVASLPPSPDSVVELRSFDGLEQVSRKLECPLLHLRSEAADEYAVVDNGTVYLYRIPDQPTHRLGRVVSTNSDSPRHAAARRDATAKRAETS